jgi:testis-specific serine kinase
MQFAENGSILDLIHKERRLPEARACNYFRQIMAGIEYCHSQGVAHRDIKCENILLDENFVVKLIDFGFAKCYRDTPKTPAQEKLDVALNDLTKSVASKKSSGMKGKDKEVPLCETYCGSYAYASPEILKGIPYDPYRSDLWAMGCVLYAMVFGRLPFDDRDPAKLIRVREP